MKSRCVISAIAAGVFAAPAHAGVIAESNFDSGPDGWTFPASVEWRATGGNGDGHLYGAIPENENITAGAFAPAEFLGSWASLDGTGMLTFDYKRFDNGDIPRAFFPLTVQIVGPGGGATWNGIIINQPSDWLHVTVPITAAAWNIDDGTWEDILADVSVLYIQLELVLNDGPADDTAGLDNVRLVPTPGSAFLLAAGLVGASRRRRGL